MKKDRSLTNLRVKDLRHLAAGKSVEQFVAAVGPFILVERQRKPQPAKGSLERVTKATATMQSVSSAGPDMLSILKDFDNMLVATFGPRASEEISIGRHFGARLLIEEPSVSQNHATLRWVKESDKAQLRDHGSSNGTFLNAVRIGGEEVEVEDGDTLSFGDAKFMFVRTESIHSQLSYASGLDKK